MFLFKELEKVGQDGLLLGLERTIAQKVICECHYTHSIPSGKSHYYALGGAVVVYSIPANRHIGKYLLGRDGNVWELTRLWAPDGHERNLLTQAISASVKWFCMGESDVEALVSYADPNMGHEGFVYRAASWLYTGQSKESRYYMNTSGVPVSRRKFHSGARSMTKSEIEDAGYVEVSRPGKHRYARGLTRQSRRDLLRWREKEML